MEDAETPGQGLIRMKKLATKVILFSGSILLLQALISLEYRVGAAREFADNGIDLFGLVSVSFPPPGGYEPTALVKQVQRFQELHPELGFVWKPGVDTSENVVFQWADQDAAVLSTDARGFANPPEAMHRLRRGERPDIIGVGASFMQSAQSVLYEFLSLKGIFYYNMANQRYTIPQYNRAMEKYALPQKPRLVVYGLNEVSYTLIPDFEAWERSGMDWFAYHSGTWCGPAIETGFPHDLLRGYPRLYGLYRAVVEKLLPRPSGGKGSRGYLIERTGDYVLRAHETARREGSAFVVLLIPSKQTVTTPSTPSRLFDTLQPRLADAGVPVVDLRKDFAGTEDPLGLYYKVDGHWNRHGIMRTARAIAGVVNQE